MTIQETINAFEKYIKELLAKGYSAEKAVKKAYKKYPVMDAVYKETMASLHVAVEEGYEGPLPKGLVAEAIQLSWAPDGLTLSDRTTKGNAAVIAMAKSTIDIAMRKNTARTELTKKLFDGYGSRGILPTQDIPRFMDKLASLGRSGYNDEELRAAIRTAERNIKQLNTRGLQAAYATMVDAVKKGNEKALTKAVYVATQEQTRYLADRIARTERARAYYDGFMAKWAGGTDVVAFKWCLSSRHPVHDICDLYAKADLYGLGEGIFPKDKVPMLPAHPHCMCRLKPIFEGQINIDNLKDNVEAGGKAFIDTLSVREKEHLLGVYGSKAVEAGLSWTAKVRGYSGKLLSSRIKEADLMALNILKPSDEYLSKLATKQNKIYTKGKRGSDRFYSDDGLPIWPENEGAVGNIRNITLKANALIVDRYGVSTGKYLAPADTPWEMRSLPVVKDKTDPRNIRHFYRIKQDFDVSEGIVAPWFGRKGGGIQYKTSVSVQELINNGIIEEVSHSEYLRIKRNNR